jgi:methyl-accepting chemotaxis protein
MRFATLSARVRSAFAALAITLVLLAGGAALAMSRIYDGTTVFGKRVVPLDLLKRVADAYAVPIVDNNHKMRMGLVSYADGAADIIKNQAAIDSAWRAYTAGVTDSAERAIVASAQAKKSVADTAIMTLLARAQAGDRVGLIEFAEKRLYQVIDPLSTEISTLIAYQMTAASAQFTAIEKLYFWSRVVMGIVVLIAAGFASWIGLSTSRTLTNGVSRIQATLESLRTQHLPALRAGADAIARGELSQSVHVAYTPSVIAGVDELSAVERSAEGVLAEVAGVAAAAEASRNKLVHVLNEAATVVAGAREGRLRIRASLTGLDGAYRELAQGLNDTMSATSGPLAAASEALQRVAGRDLSVVVTRPSDRGEYQELGQALNQTVRQLGNALGELAGGTSQIATAAAEVAGGSQSLAEGSSEQAAALATVTANLAELDAKTHANSATASRVEQSMADTVTITQESVDQMAALSTAMGDIQEATQATATIAKTIEEIAFQTNLLALNASVEAARAGDAGRGFAVVADEVRALATRSSESAKQTAAMIEQTLTASRRGVSLNERVLAQFATVHERLTGIGGAMAEIAAASSEQTASVTSTKLAIERVNAVTQATAASAEESAAAAEELASQAATMLGLVERFTLPDGLSAGEVLPPRQHLRPSSSAVRKPQSSGARSGAGARGSKPAMAMAMAHSASGSALIPFDDDEPDTSALSEF